LPDLAGIECQRKGGGECQHEWNKSR
jgi:hypothetical protein